jgi:hypothetical protein
MVGILKNLNLYYPNSRLVYSLLILKNLLLLSLIALIFMFFVSFFTKANNEKIIEGNWFKSNAQKRREAQAAKELRELIERQRQLCQHPTSSNFRSCGPIYYFPEAHFKEGSDQAQAKADKKYKNSDKPDKELASNAHKLL